MAVLNLVATTNFTATIRDCFSGHPEERVLKGPLTLFRLAGSVFWKEPGDSDPPGTKAHKITANEPERGPWWFDRAMLDALSDDVLEASYEGTRWARRNVLAGTRTDLAVKERWSNMSWFCILRLLSGQELVSWSGPAEQQQDRGTGFFAGMMPGGGIQYFVPGLRDLPHLSIERMPTVAALDRLAASPSWRG